MRATIFELGDPGVSLEDLRLELADPRVARRKLGIFAHERLLEIRDPFVAPIRRHAALIAHPPPNGKPKQVGTI
jgi:hypothetical protein